MKQCKALAVLAILLAAPAALATTDLADLRPVDANCFPLHYGVACTVEVLVVSGTELGWSGPAYIEDSTAGMTFFNMPLGLLTGDYITLNAWLVFYSGLLQLDDDPINEVPATFVIHSRGNPVAPNIITIPEMGETHEGKLIQLLHVHFLETGSFASRTYEIQDAQGNIGVLYVDSSTSVVGQPIPEGWLNITGCLGQYDLVPPWCDDYQIIPRTVADIEDSPTAVAGGSASGVNLSWTGVKLMYR